MSRYEKDKPCELALLASTFGEPIEDIAKFARCHLILCKESNTDAILIIAFEKVEEHKAIKILNTVKEWGLEHYYQHVINRKGKGFPSCLNLAIKEIKAQYYMRIDTDDRCLPERLDDQYMYTLRTRSDITYGWMNAKNGKLMKYPKSKFGLWVLIACGLNPIPHPTVCFNRKIILDLGGYNEKLRRSEDFELWLRVLKSEGIKLGCITRPLIEYNLKGAEDKDKENAAAQIRIRIRNVDCSIKTLPIITGIAVNIVRLAMPKGLLLKVKRVLQGIDV